MLRHLRYLTAVAEHQNFTRAAQELHVSQPTLSQQIKQLETTLHVQLLDRSGRTVRLTDAGEAYLRYARRALLELDAGTRAIHDVQDLSRGSLRLAMTPTFTAYLIGRWSNVSAPAIPASA
ncbi:UNVERIFIED_ORG: DNA-binding transcriptional LysR family regulator [Arthrobacter sp. UYCu721]